MVDACEGVFSIAPDTLQPLFATQLLGMFDAERERLGAIVYPIYRNQHEKTRQYYQMKLGSPAFEENIQKGRLLKPADHIDDIFLAFEDD